MRVKDESRLVVKKERLERGGQIIQLRSKKSLLYGSVADAERTSLESG